MLKYVNVLLANTAVSFCHYENANFDKTEWISKELLIKIIDYCKNQNLLINFIFPRDDAPVEILELIGKTEHLKIAPYKALVDATAIVLEPSDFNEADWSNSFFDNKIIILRVNKNEIKKISSLLEKLENKYTKITLVLTDIESYNDEYIEIYKEELEKTEDWLFRQYKNVKETLPEINFVSDLWFSEQMNNCNAGVNHYTFAPDGKFYICPAFYNNGGQNIGDLSEINVKNHHLFSLEFAPLCNICDAFHCKRCIFLNYLLTEEFNTPSYQQCRLAHVERECSRKLLERLKKSNQLFLQIRPINSINYSDPMERIISKEIDYSRSIL